MLIGSGTPIRSLCAQFDAIYQALPSANMQLLVETAVESGFRWGSDSSTKASALDSHRK